MSEINKEIIDKEIILLNHHRDDMNYLKSMAVDNDFELLKYVAEFARMTLKGIFVLNGTAAVATLTLFTNVLINKPDISANLLWIVLCFAIGSLFASLACSCSYYAQEYRQKQHGYDFCKIVAVLALQQLDEKEVFYANQCGIKLDNDKLREEQQLFISEHTELSEKFKVKANKKMNWVVSSVVLSYVCFFTGIMVAALIFS